MREQDLPGKEALIAAIKQGFQPEYLFFWGHQAGKDGRIGKQSLSQWFASSFRVDGIIYPTAEHFMMAEKARLFGDEEIREKILLAPGPDVAKKLGKLVRGFDEEKWLQNRFDLIIRGNIAKFEQNEQLKQFLLETKEKVLVEASPYDTIWGIGIAENDPSSSVPEQWKGLNLLGFALIVVRSRLADSL
jgi:ribA/ribD-fused uncharacterized protein